MASLTPHEEEASRTLDVLGRLGGVGAPEDFADAVMRRLPPGGIPDRGGAARGAALVIIALAVLAVLNALTIVGASSRNVASAGDAAVDSLAVEYDLAPRSLRTWE